MAQSTLDSPAISESLTRRAPGQGKRKRKLPSPTHLLLILIAVVTAFPFYAMIVIALQPGRGLEMPGALFPTDISLDSFVAALSSTRVPRWFLNTLIYAVVSVVLVLLFAAMAGYAFAKKRFWGRDVMFWSFVAMLMVPGNLTLIPQFIIVTNLGGLNTMWGLIVPTLANVQAMFLMRQFIRDIPDEIIEAARIDGAGEMRIFFSIILPQTKPVMSILGVMVFLAHWNDFLWPLVSQQHPDNFTLSVGLNSMQEELTMLSTTMAGAVLMFIPTLIIFISVQKNFVRGIVMSGIK
ncbi:carbohydrate ABC transporter permease [Microbacterium sp. A93]|uniref:carbohydrate ABC transporter permease n=1 Tax=unclassified Microbacterium TaxID=2609290 RepID=UPI003F41DD6E